MLPKDWVAAFSLDEGLICPVVSLYAVVDNETLAVLSTDTRLERIKIEKNLRYDLIADKVTEEAIQEATFLFLMAPSSFGFGSSPRNF